jgi:hypothetical protein
MRAVKSAAAVSGFNVLPRAACLKRKTEQMLTANPAGLAGAPRPRIMAAARPAERSVIPVPKTSSLKLLTFLVQLFRRQLPTKQFS